MDTLSQAKSDSLSNENVRTTTEQRTQENIKRSDNETEILSETEVGKPVHETAERLLQGVCMVTVDASQDSSSDFVSAIPPHVELNDQTNDNKSKQLICPDATHPDSQTTLTPGEQTGNQGNEPQCDDVTETQQLEHTQIQELQNNDGIIENVVNNSEVEPAISSHEGSDQEPEINNPELSDQLSEINIIAPECPEHRADNPGYPVDIEIFDPTGLKCLTEVEVNETREIHTNDIGHIKHGCTYLSRYLKYLDKKQEAGKQGYEDIPGRVQDFVTRVIAKINSTKRDFNYSSPVPCGSFKEGVKVTSLGDFDFMITIGKLGESSFIDLDTSKLEFRHCDIPLTKPQKTNTSLEQKAFFKIFIDQNEVTDMGLDSYTAVSDGNQKLELRAHRVQKQFCEEVKKTLGRNCHVTASGPAVCLHVTRAGDQGKMMDIKIDLTIGIKKTLKKEEISQFGITLKKGTRNSCYFVPAHSFWRMSFSDQESKLIAKLKNEDDRKCLRALKVLRDELVTGREQQTILDTYPLKVSLLHVVESRTPESDPKLGDTALGVLQHIETKGAAHELEDNFIHGNSIMYESDKSYLESIRIIQHLKDQSHDYVNNGYWHTCILSLIVGVFLVLAGGNAWFYFSAVITDSPTTEEDCLTVNKHFEWYSSIQQGALWFLIGLTGIGGLGYQQFQRYCFRARLYKVFNCGLLVMYIVLLISSMALLSVQYVIVNEIIETGSDETIECKLTKKAKSLSLAVFSLSCIVIGVAVCYVVVFAIFYRRRLKVCPKSIFDFFFCDDYCGCHRFGKPKYESKNAGIDGVTESDCHI